MYHCMILKSVHNDTKTKHGSKQKHTESTSLLLEGLFFTSVCAQVYQAYTPVRPFTIIRVHHPLHLTPLIIVSAPSLSLSARSPVNNTAAAAVLANEAFYRCSILFRSENLQYNSITAGHRKLSWLSSSNLLMNTCSHILPPKHNFPILSLEFPPLSHPQVVGSTHGWRCPSWGGAWRKSQLRQLVLIVNLTLLIRGSEVTIGSEIR